MVYKEGAVLMKSRKFSLLLKLLHLSANQSKMMRVQEEALAHLLIQRQTHFFSAEGRGGGTAGVNGVNGQYSNSDATSSCIDTAKHGSGGTGSCRNMLKSWKLSWRRPNWMENHRITLAKWPQWRTRWK